MPQSAVMDNLDEEAGRYSVKLFSRFLCDCSVRGFPFIEAGTTLAGLGSRAKVVERLDLKPYWEGPAPSTFVMEGNRSSSKIGKKD